MTLRLPSFLLGQPEPPPPPPENFWWKITGAESIAAPMAIDEIGPFYASLAVAEQLYQSKGFAAFFARPTLWLWQPDLTQLTGGKWISAIGGSP